MLEFSRSSPQPQTCFRHDALSALLLGYNDSDVTEASFLQSLYSGVSPSTKPSPSANSRDS